MSTPSGLPPRPTAEPAAYLTFTQAAHYCGCSRIAILKAVKAGVLPRVLLPALPGMPGPRKVWYLPKDGIDALRAKGHLKKPARSRQGGRPPRKSVRR